MGNVSLGHRMRRHVRALDRRLDFLRERIAARGGWGAPCNGWAASEAAAITAARTLMALYVAQQHEAEPRTSALLREAAEQLECEALGSHRIEELVHDLKARARLLEALEPPLLERDTETAEGAA